MNRNWRRLVIGKFSTALLGLRWLRWYVCKPDLLHVGHCYRSPCEPCCENKAPRLFCRISLTVRMPGPLARPHVQLLLKFPLNLPLTWANSIGSGETAQMRRLAWTLAVLDILKWFFSHDMTVIHTALDCTRYHSLKRARFVENSTLCAIA